MGPEDHPLPPNGTVQKLYKPACVFLPQTTLRRPSSARAMVAGIDGSAVWASRDVRKVLGMSYALENSYAAADADTRLRWSDGYYVQAMVVAGKTDFHSGWGIARMLLTDSSSPRT